MSLKPHQFTFGPFRLDPANHLLLRGQEPVPLAPKAFDTLVYLVENGHNLVTREELMRVIWPDSFVEDANLTVNISLLRKALGDRDDRKPYIETVPRKGYRFNADIARVEIEAQTGISARSAGSDDSEAGPSQLSDKGEPERPAPVFHVTERGTNRSLEAVARQSAPPAVITFPEPKRTPQEASQPQVAVPSEFVREKPEPSRGLHRALGAAAGLMVIGLLAGWLLWHRSQGLPQPRQQRLTSFAPEMAVTADAISTGAKFIAYANPNGLFIQVIATGETHALALPTPGFHVSSISWFPDSARLLVGGSRPEDGDQTLWIVPVIGTGPAVKVGPYPFGVVSPDGSQIALLAEAGNAPEIQVMPSEGGAYRTIALGKSGEIFHTLAWSHDSRRVLFVRLRWDPQRRRNTGSIESYDLPSGKTITVLSGSDFGGDIASLAGGRIAYSRLLGANPSAYGCDLMEVKTDLQTGKAEAAPRVLTKWDTPVTDLSANASGNRLVLRDLISAHNVYMAELKDDGTSLTSVRRFSFGVGRDDFARAWTPDSQAVFIDSNRNGNWQIFKQALGEVSEEPFVQGPDDQFSPRVSPDGQWLLYLDRPKNWQEPEPVSLMRVPISGGLPRVVLKAQEFSEWGLRFECPRRTGMPCVLAQRQGQQAVFLPFDPLTGLRPDEKELARHDYDPLNAVNWSVSPDGLQLAWLDWDPTGARIHVLPLSKSGDGLVAGGSEHDVIIPRRSRLHAIAWAPNGKGWFVATQLPASWTLLYVDAEGKPSPLVKVANTYAPDVFPSPDGRHITFAELSFWSNVWMLQNF